MTTTNATKGFIARVLRSTILIGCAIALSATAGSLWVAESEGTLRLDALDGAVVLEIPEDPYGAGAVAVDPTNGNVWTWGSERLRGFDREGVNFLDIESSSYPLWEHPNDLLVDGNAGNIWLNLGSNLYRLNLSGQVVGSLLDYGTTCNSMTLDRERSRLWLCSYYSVKAYDATFQEVVSLPLLSSDVICQSAWDEFRDELWVAVNDKLRRYDSAGVMTFEMQNPAGLTNTNFLKPDGKGGLWLGSETQFVYIDPTGAVGSWITPFHDFSYLFIRDAVVHPVDASIWIGNETHLRRFSTAGAQLQDRFLDLGDGNGRYLENMDIFEDQSKPIIEFSLPANNSATNQTRPTLRLVFLDSGSGIDDDTLELTINEAPLAASCTVDALGAECVPNAALSDGLKTVTARISDTSGNESDPATVRFTIDTVAPQITVSSPANGSITNQQNVVILGSVSEAAALRINGTLVPLSGSIGFSFTTTLVEGGNARTLVATDNATNSTSVGLSITLDTQAPNVPNVGFISVSSPVSSVVTVTGQVGSVEANAVVMLTNLRTGQSVAVNATADGAFVAQIAGEETDQLQLQAVDAAQNSSGSAQVSVPGSLPPDPATVATPLATTAVTSFGDSTAFLYTGANPIQSGVAAGTIQRDFAAVVRGTVTTRTGQPLPNVRVSIKDRPEFGQTRSRANGEFDLALNGAETVVINYERPGYLPVQRRVFVQPHDYTVAENVILIQVDASTTPVVFGSTSTQAHRSSVSQDVDGSRAATVVILPGTTATMRLPDGSSQPLAAGQIRATEYSVGLNGRQAMPGELPASSAYTYAVELSLDEALQAGATRVDFSRPIPVYVSNFLETPVGQVVPVGSFDRARAAWVPEDDGRVIRILSVDATGLAILDVDGSGDSATPQQLTALGISDQERRQLALSFAAQTSIWRFQASHFSPWDCNWPYDFPADFEAPPALDDDIQPPDDEESLECEGCRIDVQSQALQQDLSITGAEFGLHYRSDRQPRRAVIDVPVTDGTVPNSLLFVRATASIAGRVVSSVQSGSLLSTQLQAPQPNLRLVYEWDGRDIYGRSIVGSVPVTIRVTHYYAAVYLGAARNVQPGNLPPRAFAAYSQSGVEVMAAALIPNPNIPLESVSRVAAAERTVTQFLDGKDPATNQIGGWTLTPHHSFDPLTRAVTFGDGGRQTINTQPLTIRSVPSQGGPFGLDYSGPQFGTIRGLDFVRLPQAPTAVSEMCLGDAGNRLIYCGWTDSSYGTVLTPVAGGGLAQPVDGANALSVELDAPTDVAAPNFETVYFTSAAANRIWKLVRTRQPGAPWTLRLVAGTGTAGSTGDGGFATQATLNSPNGVVVTGDGTVFVAESAGHRIRRIGPDGRINTIAGDGTAGFSGDGGPAALARMNTPAGLALGADGSLYVADQGNRRVRRIDTTGSISTVAGDGTACPVSTDLCGDNGSALNAQLSAPTDVAAFGDGRIAIADVGTRRIRLVRIDGVIVPYVGNGQPAWASTPAGDPGAAGTAGLSETLSIAVTGRQPGSILIGDRNFLRAVDPPYARFVTDQTLGVPSMSGNEIFVFSPGGRHLETLDAVSQVRLFGFTYDALGRLSSIVDRSGNLTQIERSATGAPTAIVGPYGQRTTLDRDVNGYLSRIENPAGEAYRFAYAPEGLMTRMEDPRTNASTYAYEGDGRLRTDTDAGGGGWTLERTIRRDGPRVLDASVSMTSAEGRTTRSTWPPGGAEYSTTYPDGTRERNILRPYRNEKDVSRPDGTQTFHEFSFDRYFFPQEVKQGLMRERRPSGWRAKQRSFEHT